MAKKGPVAEITDPGYRGGSVTDGPIKMKPPIKKTNPGKDIVDSLLEAIDTTVTTRISEAHLDKTVLCTILESDWTNVENGEYYVSEGDAKYLVKGQQNTYRTGDRVWVLIPLGDYNNQKTIISRQVGDVGDSFVYISPLENFVRLTEDIVPNTSKGTYGLKTNNFRVTTNSSGKTTVTKNDSKLIASIDMTKAGAADIGGFSAFGVSAKFKTDVAGLEIMRGNYGLHFEIKSSKEELVGTTNGGQKQLNVPVTDHLYLQCNDMWGNPYGYDMFLEQSKMFEINNPGNTKIQKINIYFFQTYDEHDTNIKKDAVGAMQNGKFVNINQLDVAIPEEDNLFVQNVSIYFGHTVDNLKTSAYLYSQNSPNFIIKDNIAADINDKTLVAKFIHTDDNGKKYILNSLGNNTVYQQLLKTGSLPTEFKVRWYAYNPLATKNDLRAGSGWDDITYKISSDSTNNCLQIDKYGTYTSFRKTGVAYTDTERTFRLNDADAGYEKFKVAFILYDSGLRGTTAPTDEDYAVANGIINATSGYTDEQKQEAQTTIDRYNSFQQEIRYWSSEVQFINGDDQTWGSLDALNSLNLEFDDKGYNGNYLIYNTAISGQAKMLNSADAQVMRKIKGNFKSYITGETDLTRSKIRWYIPKNSTMISEPDWKNEHFTGYKFDSAENDYTYQYPAIRWESLNGKKAVRENGSWTFDELAGRASTDIDSVTTWNNYYIFESKINTTKTPSNDNRPGLQDLIDGKISIPYRVKEYWNQHFTNNKIICKIVRDGRVYEKSVDLRFGAHGTNGTEYSLIVNLGDEYDTNQHLVAERVPAWTRNHALTNYIILEAQLFDERNVALGNDVVTYTWKINDFEEELSDSNIFGVAQGSSGKWYITIKGNPTSIASETWAGAYLTCTATYRGKDYTQDLVMPVRLSDNYVGCVGPTQVLYNYTNTAPAVSSKDKYRILNENFELVTPATTTCVYDSRIGVPQKSGGKWYSDLPYLSNIKSDDPDKSQNLATLVLSPNYYQDINYKMVVKMTVAKPNNSGGTTNWYSWIQPILVKLDVFTNTFLNRWDGSLQIDNKNNRIATAAVFSGTKNADNSFTGVIMGELQGESSNATETGYGIYGRYNGNHTFGINTNGTAYLGDSSHAQLLFTVGPDSKNNTDWKSTIENKGYIDGSQKGMRLDFIGTTSRYGKEKTLAAPYIDIININDSGPDDDDANRVRDNTLNRVTISGNQDHLLEIYAHGKQVMHIGNGRYDLRTADYERNGKYSTGTILNLKTGEFLSFGQKDTEGSNATDHALLISNKGVYPGWQVNGHSATDTDPNVTSNQGGWVLYSHGNFGVDTTGKLFATGGDFAGKIVSTEGQIGGWTITANTLRSGNTNSTSDGAVTIANADFSRSINGTNRTELRLAIGSKFAVKKDGTLYASGGVFSGTISSSSITSSSININNKFKVDSNGNLTATSANITGTIDATTLYADHIWVNNTKLSLGSTTLVSSIDELWVSATGQSSTDVYKGISIALTYSKTRIYGFGISKSSSEIKVESGGTGWYVSGTSGCLERGTKILMANYTWKNIEDIKANDWVLSYNKQDNTFEPAKTAMGATLFDKRGSLVDIYLNNGKKISMTAGHPVLTQRGWCSFDPSMSLKEHHLQTELLLESDILYGYYQKYKIQKIVWRKNPWMYETYNIDVPKNNTYIANNIIVHNADPEEK